ncbi:MAG TPA: type 1 glutamine amidotransferase [Opitutaceae bacterium]|jgi:GMP synthase-like glutamine amidotransferase|nr:type 1 glutamine amidotransferase [Opitutaceae bacterium]
MRVHVFQHVPFEGPAEIGRWLERRGVTPTFTHFFAETALPPVETVDWLVVMGGPMSVNDEATLPWLRQEKDFIARAIQRGATVLGVCLGAQLIADVLGGKVTRNREREIGWFPVTRTAGAEKHPLGSCFPAQADVFHWHGETFSLPAGATHLLRSAACEHQAFAVGDRILGLQFHLETTAASACALIDNAGDDLRPGPFVQDAATMLAEADRFEWVNKILDRVLSALWEKTAATSAKQPG